MRALADRERIERFMQAIGEATRNRVRVYLVGGTTAVLMGWRASTVDVDLVMQEGTRRFGTSSQPAAMRPGHSRSLALDGLRPEPGGQRLRPPT